MTLTKELTEGFSVLISSNGLRQGATDNVWVHDSSFHWRNIFTVNQELSTWKNMSLLYSSKLFQLSKGSNVIFMDLFWGMNDVFGFSADWPLITGTWELAFYTNKLVSWIWGRAWLEAVGKSGGVGGSSFNYHMQNYCHQPNGRGYLLTWLLSNCTLF